jgi:GNAT superfamily N-acetyltransferase
MRECGPADFKQMLALINDAASAYRGKIPDDCWRQPYMDDKELEGEIRSGVMFHCCSQDGRLLGVMGLQEVADVILIRHAYVLRARQGRGIGSALLERLKALTTGRRVLVGTWAAATWAIGFYEKHGFGLVPQAEKDRLLRKYWAVNERQMEVSVVLMLQGQLTSSSRRIRPL